MVGPHPELSPAADADDAGDVGGQQLLQEAVEGVVGEAQAQDGADEGLAVGWLRRLRDRAHHAPPGPAPPARQRRSIASVAAAGVGEQDLRDLDAQEGLAGACARETTSAESISRVNTLSGCDGDAARAFDASCGHTRL